MALCPKVSHIQVKEESGELASAQMEIPLPLQVKMEPLTYGIEMAVLSGALKLVTLYIALFSALMEK